MSEGVSISRLMRSIVLIFWIFMMVMLVQKTYFSISDDYVQLSYAASQLRPKEEWMGVYWKGDKVGYTVSNIKKKYRGYEISEQAFMDLTVMGTTQNISTQVTSQVDNNFKLKSFVFVLFANISTKIQGKVQGNEMHLEISSGGNVNRSVVPLKEAPCLSSSIKPIILAQGLAVGKQFKQAFFDPSTMTNTTIDVVVEGKEKVVLKNERIECYRIKSTFKGITIRSWIDEEGNTIKEESPLGMVLVKESKSDAINENWSDSTKDIITSSAVSVDRSITVINPSYLKVKLGNIDLKEFNLSQGRQKLQGDVLEIFKEKTSGVNTYSIPYKRGFEEYLKSTAFIQSGSKVIKNKAREIIGDEKDALKVVSLVNKWVYRNIEKKPTISIPSALDVLETRQGDCNEHATLFVALCRSMGIPSKLCAGIVYTQGRFYYHAWSDVFVGSWISVDPTMNQLPADATHILFVEGELDKQLVIINLIGVLKMEVLDYK